MTEASDLQEVAEEAARAGAEVLLRFFRQDGLDVEEKSRHDLVSEADRASEAAVLEVLGRRVPGHAVLAEEGGALEGGADVEHQWLIDPLDGTSNFVHGLAYFAVSIACRRGSELLAGVVYEPAADQLFSAARGSGCRWNGTPVRVTSHAGLDGAFLSTGFPFRVRSALEPYLGLFHDVAVQAQGIRRCGAAALDLAYTAAGVYDGFFEFGLAPWDVAAGTLLIQEAGGVVSDLDGGDRFLESGNILAGAPGVHVELLRCAARVTDEAAVRELIGGEGDEA